MLHHRKENIWMEEQETAGHCSMRPQRQPLSYTRTDMQRTQTALEGSVRTTSPTPA